ncbi:MAG: histidinol-phosphate transaminase [Ruminococcaceae bacterium]|nr:histidinol-phosphate transaminase [Oscillospiraceae bacterium]
MSRFFSTTHKNLVPYVPGEQLNDKKYIKLNTNESPYPPSDKVKKAVSEEVSRLMLYSDPDSKELVSALAKRYNLPEDCVVVTNGSDEILNFAFLAFCDSTHPAIFPDLTYGFYKVFANLYNLPYTEIPLNKDFTVSPEDYMLNNATVFLANPNAPTGIALELSEIEKIVKANPDNVVIIDEAYVDFGTESAVSLVNKYDNLLVTQTFSKSRSLAGARLGMGFASPELIKDINTLRYSTNPYNVNRMTMKAGVSAIEDDDYYMNNCKKIQLTRDYTASSLKELGFFVTDSKANFLFAESKRIKGSDLYVKLKEKGVLIRHFESDRISNFNRITIGTQEQMEIFISKVLEILEEEK